jgi:hypothetical protein
MRYKNFSSRARIVAVSLMKRTGSGGANEV